MEQSVNKPALVSKEGRIVRPGDLVTSFRGEQWTLHGIELPRHEGSSGRVYVTRECDGCDGPGEHQYWCSGQQEHEFFPSVFDLEWTQASTV